MSKTEEPTGDQTVPHFVTAFEPQHGVAVPVADGIERLTAPNPSPFTFHGTNTYIVGEKSVCVIDPGPENDAHFEALMVALQGREVSHIAVSHTHRDHSPLARRLKEKTGAVIVAEGPHRPARPLFEGEVNPFAESSDVDFTPDIALADGATVDGEGWRLTAVHTPGHTANHAAFALDNTGILFSADHVMAWATSIVAPPDGAMADYMASLDRLRARDDRIFLPGHGPPLPDPQPFMAALAAHAHGAGARVLVEHAACAGIGTPVEGTDEAGFAARADLLVAVGGDGTLLHAARLAHPRDLPLLGINRGRLGFLADVAAAEMLERFGEVLVGRYSKDVRHLLAARVLAAGEPERRAVALNDVVLQKWETGRMLDFETWIDGRYVNTHGGDGLVVATATGSTAYALSCGGPIIQPDLDALVLAPICPHTLSDRPIVVSRRCEIEVRLVPRAATKAQVTCDGIVLGDLDPEARLLIGPAAEQVTLLHPPGYDYYRILRSKLHWGRGARHAHPET